MNHYEGRFYYESAHSKTDFSEPRDDFNKFDHYQDSQVAFLCRFSRLIPLSNKNSNGKGN